MPRLPRFAAAGVLLFTAVLLVVALLAQPSYRWVGVTAAAVFLPLWYAIAVLNAWLGVATAGYPVRAEAAVAVPVFGVPAGVAVLAAWASRRLADGGPHVHGGRFWFVWLAGLALWAAVLLLIGLLADPPGRIGRSGPAALVFGPLWLLVCAVMAAVGVRVAGYGVAEELAVSLLNVSVPVAASVLAWRAAAHRA